MKALVYQGPGEISLEEVAAPSPAADEVLLRVDAAGVCGTDRHIVAGELGVRPGTVPGHEIAGTIVGVGSGRPRLPPLARFIGAELSVRGSFGSTPAEIAKVLELIERGALDVSRSVQREVRLGDAASIFSQRGGPARTVILPQGQEPSE